MFDYVSAYICIIYIYVAIQQICLRPGIYGPLNVRDHGKKLEVIGFSFAQGLKETDLSDFYHSFPYASHSWGVQRYFYVVDSVAYKTVSELITVQMMFYYIFS